MYQYRIDTSLILQKRNQEIPQDKWKWKNKFPKSMEWSKDISEREVHSNKPSQEIRKISNKWSNLSYEGIRKRKTSPSQQKKENKEEQRGNK